MSQRRKAESDDDLLPEYDFSGAVRGKYYERYRQGTNVVLLDPDIAAVFHDSAAVNHHASVAGLFGKRKGGWAEAHRRAPAVAEQATAADEPRNSWCTSPQASRRGSRLSSRV